MGTPQRFTYGDLTTLNRLLNDPDSETILHIAQKVDYALSAGEAEEGPPPHFQFKEIDGQKFVGDVAHPLTTTWHDVRSAEGQVIIYNLAMIGLLMLQDQIATMHKNTQRYIKNVGSFLVNVEA